jgi:ribosome-associated toxin RatA of RatAB toxin-antitoxin module
MEFPSLPATARDTFPFSPEVIYKALADYDAWQEWVPSVTASRLLSAEDVLAVVELGSGREETLMLECVQTPNKAVWARVIEGKSAIREVQWSVAGAGEGISQVTVTVKWTPGWRLIAGTSWPALSPAKHLRALRSWVSAAYPGPETIVGGENLFELWKTEAGLVCWVRGKKYKLIPVEEKRE